MAKHDTKILVGLVTFGVFMTEAIIHYNMGYRASKPQASPPVVLPPTHELIKLGAVVGAFSIVNAFLVDRLSK